MNFTRKELINKLVRLRGTNLIKVISGLRRSGKSYLLFTLYKQYLIDHGVDASHIIEIALDSLEQEELQDIHRCWQYIKERIQDEQSYYVFIDEIQLMQGFEKLMNTLLHYDNIDVYVTGSNSHFLSSDIVTEFRGRSADVRVYPLTMSELQEAYPARTWDSLWQEYMLFGGLPFVWQLDNAKEKRAYLRQLFSKTYLKDIKERHNIQNELELNKLVDVIASAIGSLTNPTKLANTFQTELRSTLTAPTIQQYLDYLEDAYLIEKAVRYDVKGRRYISTPYKYYFTDAGLRNVRLNFRQTEATHLMENIIYTELRSRDLPVDVGVVEVLERTANGYQRTKVEIDFVVNDDDNRYYIQSAYSLPTTEKRQQEERPLLKTDDAFKKVIVVGDYVEPHRTENGILIMGLQQFLQNRDSLKQ